MIKATVRPLAALLLLSAVPAAGDEIPPPPLFAQPSPGPSFEQLHAEARLLAGRGQLPEALERYRQLFALRPQPSLFCEIAPLYRRLGEAASAFTTYRRCLEGGTGLSAGERRVIEEELRRLHQVMAELAIPVGESERRAGQIRLVPIRYELRTHRGLLGAGLGVLVPSYAAAFISGIIFGSLGRSSQSGAGWSLLIPVLGPFISSFVYAGENQSSSGGTLAWGLPWSIVDGGLQVVGATLTILGAVRRRLVALPLQELTLLPTVGPGGGGLTVAARF